MIDAVPMMPFLNVLFPVPCQLIGVLTSNKPLIVVDEDPELPSKTPESSAENRATGTAFDAIPGNQVTLLVAGTAPEVFHSKIAPSFQVTTDAEELAKLP